MYDPVGSPRAPIEVSVSDITAISALIRWTIPFIVSTQETYYVLYALDQNSLTLQSALQMSGPNISRVYFQLLSNLDAAETYYYRVIASNNVGETGSDLESFMTPSGRKLTCKRCAYRCIVGYERFCGN